MKSLLAVLLFSFSHLSFGHEAFACTTPGLSKTLIESVERITHIKTPWNRFEYESLRFVFRSPKSNMAFGYGFSQTELNNFSELSITCDSTSWHALVLDDLPDPTNGIYEPQHPKEDGSVLQKLALANNAPIMLMLAEPNIGTNLTDEFISRVGVHELFHFQFQFTGNFKIENGYPRNFLDKCALNKKWVTSLNNEFVMWSSLLKNWNTYSNANRIQKVKTIASLRHSFTSSEEKFCWDATRFWERLEGTAYYVETESATMAGFSSVEEIRTEAMKYLDSKSSTVSTGAPESQQIHVNPSFFYATGALFIRVARHANNENELERMIENGLSPEEAFTQLAETTSIQIIP